VCPESIISLNERGEIIFWNGAAEKLFGYSRKEIFGKSLAMFTTRKDRERYTRIFNILKKLRTPKIATELQCIKRDGKEISEEKYTNQLKSLVYLFGIIVKAHLNRLQWRDMTRKQPIKFSHDHRFP
jgi:PAS domain S-box-containing protein